VFVRSRLIAPTSRSLSAQRPTSSSMRPGVPRLWVDRYRVISACINAGIDYLDFADAADFVFGVPQFDARRRPQACSFCPASVVFPC